MHKIIAAFIISSFGALAFAQTPAAPATPSTMPAAATTAPAPAPMEKAAKAKAPKHAKKAKAKAEDMPAATTTSGPVAPK